MNILFVVLFVNQSRYRSQKSGYSKIIEIHISLFGNRHNFFERKKNKQKKTWKITFWKNYDNLALCARAYQSGFFSNQLNRQISVIGYVWKYLID